MAKKAARRTSTRRSTVRSNGKIVAHKDQLNPVEAAELFDQLESEARSATAWAAMTATEGDEGDRWHDIEEKLVRPPVDPGRGWKYFAK